MPAETASRSRELLESRNSPLALFTRVFSAFSYRDFRLMWMGACTSTIGTFVQQFAQSWLVYDLTKKPFYLGLDLFLGMTPIMLFSLVGGVFADRNDRRKLLLTSQYIQMTCAFILTVLFYTHAVQVWHILTLSFVVGCGQSIGGPGLFGAAAVAGESRGSVQRHRHELDPVQPGAHHGADHRRDGLHRVGRHLVLLPQRDFLHRRDHFAVHDPREIRSVQNQRNDLTSMKEGIQFIRQREGMSALVVLAFLMTLLGFSLVGFLPVFVQTVFEKGPQTYQLLLVCSGAGSVTGGLIVAGAGPGQAPGTLGC